MMFVSQLSLKGPPGPLGLTGRPGPLVSVHQPAEPAISVTKNKYNCISYSVCVCVCFGDSFVHKPDETCRMFSDRVTVFITVYGPKSVCGAL